MTNLTNSIYTKLRDLILASEGKTLEEELGFGCLVKTDEGIETVIVDFGIDDFKGYGWIKTTHSAKLRYDKNESDFEILGLPISLERVLRALGRECAEIKIELESDGCFYIETSTDYFIVWKFKRPLHEQPQEVWEKLIEILS